MSNERRVAKSARMVDALRKCGAIPALFLIAAIAPAVADHYRDIYWICNSPVLDENHVKACTQVILLNNYHPENQSAAYIQRAKARLALGDYDAALTDADAAIKLYENNPEGYFIRAEVFRKRDKPDQARIEDENTIQAASQIIEKSPGQPSGYATRAWMYHLMGKDDLALPDAEKSVTMKPLAAGYLVALGEIQEKLGQTDKARANFETVMKLSVPQSRVGGLYQDWSWQRAHDGLARLGATP